MKIIRLNILTGLLLIFGLEVHAQTAATYIAQGRSYLASSNLNSANQSFSNAVYLSSGDPTGNVFYAFTRLLVLPSQPSGSNFLTRWGVPVAGRSVYHWTAFPRKDSGGIWVAPTGVDASEATALLRTNILAAVIAAESNLGVVADTNFTLSLTGGEAAGTAVVVDYGDVQLLRSLLKAVEYLIYNTYAWNLDVQLTELRSSFEDNQFFAGNLLAAHPNLLAFATTNDLAGAANVFTNGINLYLTASEFIHARPSGVTRLFNIDANEMENEAKFRDTLTDLADSFGGRVISSVNPDLEFFMPPQFTGTHPPRSFLPKFYGASFALGSLPDPTFGGTLFGLKSSDLEEFLARDFGSIPDISPSLEKSEDTFQFSVFGLAGHGYVVQTSTDLQNWVDHAAFVSFGGSYSYSDVVVTNGPTLFYRVEDRTGSLPPPLNDNFADRIPLTGLGVMSMGYNDNGTTEFGEPTDFGSYGATAWWSWKAHSSGLVAVTIGGSTAGYVNMTIYTGTNVYSLNPVPEVYPPNGYFYSGEFQPYVFQAVAGTTYQIQVAGSAYDPDRTTGGIRLYITAPPTLTVNSPATNEIMLAVPAGIPVSAVAVSAVDQITRFQCVLNGVVVASTTNLSLNCVCSNFVYGYNDIQISAADSGGLQINYDIQVTIPPPNDNFANRIHITGAPVAVTGANFAATGEVGEPPNSAASGGSSVWWSWTAPADGSFAVAAALEPAYATSYSTVGVYRGSTVSGLTAVASGSGFYANNGEPAIATFDAVAGGVYQISVDGQYGFQGDISLKILPSQPPVVSILTPTNGSVFYAGSNVMLTSSASDINFDIVEVDYFVISNNVATFLDSSTFSPYTVARRPSGIGSYTVEAVAYDASNLSVTSAPVTFTVVFAPPPPTPPNDHFDDRKTLTGGNIVVAGSNVRGTREAGEPDIAGNQGGASVWWTWTAPKTGTVTISTFYSEFDTLLGVYTGDSVPALVLVASDDDYNNSVQSLVSFVAKVGTTYQIAVDGYDGASGSIILNVSQP